MLNISSILEYVFFAIAIISFSIIGAKNIVTLDDNADLTRYLSSSSDLIEQFSEPLSSIIFDYIYSISNGLELPWLLPALVAFAVYSTIFFSKPKSTTLKFFWYVSLVPTLSLINVRNGLIFFFVPFLPALAVIWTGLFLHWSYFLLLASRFYKSIIFWIIFGASILIFSLAVFDLSSIANKILHYVGDDNDPDYGVGLFIYLSLLWFGLRSAYISTGVSPSVLDSIFGLALLLASIGLPVPSGRLAYFTIILSLIELRGKELSKFSGLSRAALLLSAIFQVYFFGRMTNIVSWNI
ncbi:hypothetical protein LNV09_10170 [Paucibacter sp. B2R-40]|uniref:hypothetical protein n=1 Tax=Paucibacter sp. B2R-40 TaxID=2893554 RepID=UPI0021E3FAD0|nr:hypothetical protein [Paucibacter sp. B2R-40]MCV2354528.1 hypothetical protein [Paucibacter sp. B2R-40]